MDILILDGDGIGPEIAAASATVLEHVNDQFALGLVAYELLSGGLPWGGARGEPRPKRSFHPERAFRAHTGDEARPRKAYRASSEFVAPCAAPRGGKKRPRFLGIGIDGGEEVEPLEDPHLVPLDRDAAIFAEDGVELLPFAHAAMERRVAPVDEALCQGLVERVG